ncbi:MAG: tetratricopeptide repeat protein [Candidatus Latescibacteria bacterium]|nr:tetratricopeptide repeat protein [Candidatus Latescibacterota bacterium]
MRGLLAIGLWLVWVSAALGQGPAVAAFNQGNEHYRQGEYPQARESYLAVVAAGIADPQVYYNLGNACFKAGRLGEAVLWYERARRLAPRDADLLANLRFAEGLRLDQTGPAGGVGQWLEEVYLFPTLDELSLVFSLVFLAACGLGGWRLWQRTWGTWWRLGLFAGALCLAVIAGIYLGARYYGQAQAQAVVIAAEVSARSAPDPAQTPVFVVHEGTRLALIRSEGEWLLVRLPGGLSGWVPAGAVEAI